MSTPLHAVILAGGAGERFWPASRKARPKPFLEVIGGESLLDATLARARRFARGDRVWIVCGAEHARAVQRESGLPRSRILVEPERKNTAMAAAWAALRIQAEEPDAVMAILPADHYIPDAAGFARTIKRVARSAAKEPVLLTLGVEPTSPNPGYGYIQAGDPVGDDHPGILDVKRFVEKPSVAKARRYVAKGGYAWNAGIFVWATRTLLAEIHRCAPELYAALGPLLARPRGRNRPAIEAAYAGAPSLPIDVAVMERSKHVWTLPLPLYWNDVGTWGSLGEQLGVGERAARGQRKDGNRVIAGELLAHEAVDNLVWSQDRIVALVGVENLAVVDTGDVTLVTKLERSSDVRRLVAALKRAGREELL